jgi:hypothetical protein
MRWLLLLVVATACSCAEPIGHATLVAPGIPPSDGVVGVLGPWSTFSFGPVEMPPPGFRMSTRYRTVRAVLPAMVAATLEARGYRLVDTSADLVVTFGAGLREIPWPSPGGDGGDDDDYVQGTLVVDAFAAPDQRRVWHAALDVPIDPGHVDNSRLRRAVDRVLATFPAPRSVSR